MFRALYLICMNVIQRVKLELSLTNTSVLLSNLSLVQRFALFVYASNKDSVHNQHTNNKGNNSSKEASIIDASALNSNASKGGPRVYVIPNGVSVYIVVKITFYCSLISTVFCVINILANTDDIYGSCPFHALIPITSHRIIVSLANLYVITELINIDDSFHIKKDIFLSVLISIIATIMFVVVAFLPDDSPLGLLGNNLWPTVGYVTTHLYSCVIPLIKSYLHVETKLGVQYSKEAFERALADKATFSRLKELAIKHFEVENIMFYDDYQKLIANRPNLEEKSNRSILHENSASSKRVHAIYSNFL
ncbi:hypothetical protein ROZALSC1DRAFT_29403, partial [Rozella allomycis CSF55]